MKADEKRVNIIGGGLAGSEAAYRLLKNGYRVSLFEMRPKKLTPAHKTGGLAELVCSNSLKSEEKATASGLLKAELEVMDSFLLRVAKKCRVPAGSALTVDRAKFSEAVERELSSFEGFERIDEEVVKLDCDIPTIVAAGPLCSDALAAEIARATGGASLHFYDAVAPIISADSVDLTKAFFAARYGKGDPEDYLNCAMNREEYDAFYDALTAAETVMLKNFEKSEIFEGCMPVEVMAKRGRDTLRFGPLRPVGLKRDGKNDFAVVQLRRENAVGTAYNMVGFQTNLTFPEQRRVFGTIPALGNAEFLRYGVMHRNTYLESPKILTTGFKCETCENLWFAGQITGVEGYVESIASGLFAALNLMAESEGETVLAPETTICGALQRHMRAAGRFEPMNANFGILPPVEGIKGKKERKAEYYERGARDIKNFKESVKRWK